MILSADSSKLLRSFTEFQKVLDRKLNNMVRGFSYEITKEAIEKTPLGDSSKFMQRYIDRQKAIGLNPTEGFARGSWQVKKDSNFTIQEMYGVNSSAGALSLAQSSLSALTYKDSIFIGNRGYYLKALEKDNYSTQTNGLGIMKPAQDAILATYSISIKALYDQG